MLVIRMLAQIAEIVFLFAISMCIPAALLYPAALWMMNHTQYSSEFVTKAYGITIVLLFLPTLVLVAFLYRKFILKINPSN
jgi:hypothetical protein